MTFNFQDLHLYLSMIDMKKSINKADVAFQGAPDMSKKLDNMAVKAMAQYHNPQCNHHFITRMRMVGNSVEYFGECRYCGKIES